MAWAVSTGDLAAGGGVGEEEIREPPNTSGEPTDNRALDQRAR